MENEYLASPELQVDVPVQNYLRETSKWTRFIAIVSFVFMGLAVLALVFMFAFKGAMAKAFSQSPQFSQLEGMGTGMLITVVAFVAIIGLAVFMVVTYYMLRFSTQTNKAIIQNDQVALELGIGSLKNYMIITGVLGIIGLVFGLLQLLIIL